MKTVRTALLVATLLAPLPVHGQATAMSISRGDMAAS